MAISSIPSVSLPVSVNGEGEKLPLALCMRPPSGKSSPMEGVFRFAEG